VFQKKALLEKLFLATHETIYDGKNVTESLTYFSLSFAGRSKEFEDFLLCLELVGSDVNGRWS
jgi:hypothetical protein